MQVNPNQESVTSACIALAEALGLDADAIMVEGRTLPTIPILGIGGYEVTVTIMVAAETEPQSEQMTLSPELADLAARVDALFE